MTPLTTPSPAPDTARRAELVERNLAELLTRDELIALLEGGQRLRHYIGYEISGRVHLGGGLVAMAKVRDFLEAGVDCTVLLADWHTWINDKLGGDRDRIRRLAFSYYGEAMKASLLCVGGDPDALRLTLASDVYADPARDYWATVIEVAKHTSVARMQRSVTILGRREGEQHDFAKLIYPAHAGGRHLRPRGAHRPGRDGPAQGPRGRPRRGDQDQDQYSPRRRRQPPSSRWRRTTRCSPGCSSRTAGRCRRSSGPRRWRR